MTTGMTKSSSSNEPEPPSGDIPKICSMKSMAFPLRTTSEKNIIIWHRQSSNGAPTQGLRDLLFSLGSSHMVFANRAPSELMNGIVSRACGAMDAVRLSQECQGKRSPRFAGAPKCCILSVDARGGIWTLSQWALHTLLNKKLLTITWSA